MAKPNAIVQRLAILFYDCFHVEVPSPDTDLLASAMLDSLQLVELLLQLEQRFGLSITIDEIDLDDLRTLERIARVVAAKAADLDALLAIPARSAEETDPVPPEARGRAPDKRTETPREETKDVGIPAASVAGGG